MAFDLSTAKPIEIPKKSKFDISTAKPIEESNLVVSKNLNSVQKTPIYRQLDIKQNPVIGTIQDVAGQAGLAFLNQAALNLPKVALRKANIEMNEPVTKVGKTAEIIGGVAGGSVGLPAKVATSSIRGAGKLAELLSSKSGKIAELGAKTLSSKGLVGGSAIGATYTPETKENKLIAPKERLFQAGGGAILGAAIPKVASKVTEVLRIKPVKEVVKWSIEKAIRPSVVGMKKSYKQMESYFDDAYEAVKNIVINKNNLSLTEKEGQQVVGKLPESLVQFSEAITQTKEQIFKQYDQIAKKAGAINAGVDLKPIVRTIRNSVNSKEMSSLFPAVKEYALKKAEALDKVKFFTPEEAQNAIKLLNKSLESFYRNPSYETASKAGLDALIVNNLRKSLDDTIINTTGDPAYQALKNAYKSMLRIEKDVNHRAVVYGRQNIKGFFDLTDIFSAGDLAAGLATMNPAYLAKAAVQSGVKSWFKYINRPDRIIKNMFQYAGKNEKFIKDVGTQAAGMVNKTADMLPNKQLRIPFRQKKLPFNPENKLTESVKPQPVENPIELPNLSEDVKQIGYNPKIKKPKKRYSKNITEAQIRKILDEYLKKP